MSFRLFSFIPRGVASASAAAGPSFSSRRTLTSSASRLATDTSTGRISTPKPIGAFRGGLIGFVAGSAATGLGIYYYTFADYRASNEMLTDDIRALQAATQHLNSYVLELEGMVDRVKPPPSRSEK